MIIFHPQPKMQTRQGDERCYQSKNDTGGESVSAQKHQASHDGATSKANTESRLIPVHNASVGLDSKAHNTTYSHDRQILWREKVFKIQFGNVAVKTIY